MPGSQGGAPAVQGALSHPRGSSGLTPRTGGSLTEAQRGHAAAPHGSDSPVCAWSPKGGSPGSPPPESLKWLEGGGCVLFLPPPPQATRQCPCGDGLGTAGPLQCLASCHMAYRAWVSSAPSRGFWWPSGSSGGFSKTPVLVLKGAHAVTSVFISQEVA